jgi:hypothetical protein
MIKTREPILEPMRYGEAWFLESLSELKREVEILISREGK